MKKLALISILSFNVFKDNAQTLTEWTQQKKTEIKYLEQQIAGLQMYIGYIQKGYKIAKKGLTAITDLKKGDFILHNDYFNSLKTINPKVSKFFRIADIFSLQSNIAKTCETSLQNAKENPLFTLKENSYIKNVFTKLLEETSNDINQVMAIITSSHFIMEDGERLLRINKIYADMLDKQVFLHRFSDDINLLGIQRLKESRDIEMSRLLNKINN